MKNDPLNLRFTGKSLNINTELHDFKPWSFDEIHAHMETQADNWDLIKK